MSEPLGPITIGPREIYDQVMRTQASVDRLADKVDSVVNDQTDHESRIRSLERNRWPLPSLAALVSVVALVLAFLTMAQKT